MISPKIPGAAALALLLGLTPYAAGPQKAKPAFTVEDILGFPSPDNLITSPAGSTVAWTFNERGVRNIYVAAGPNFQPRRVTAYSDDDGQELARLSFSSDGRTIVYVRGGDHGSNRPADPPNPAGLVIQPKVQVWSVSITGNTPPRLLGDGDGPVIAPTGDRVAFIRDRRIWIAPIDGSRPAGLAVSARGSSESPVWSPDGKTLAFVSNRDDHSFIGLYSEGKTIRFLAPSTSRDSQPVWSDDGRRIVFLRQAGTGGAPRPPLERPEQPWSILILDVNATTAPATVLTSGTTPVDPILQNPGGLGMRWAADDHLVLSLYRDGWPHLYAIHHPGAGAKPALLTSGPYMVEQWTLTPDRRSVVYSANTGSDASDMDRRHLYKVPVEGGISVRLTTGKGVEWSPAVTGDGATIALLAATATLPPRPATLPIAGGVPHRLGAEAPSFPSGQLVTPELVHFHAADGVEAHGQLFRPAASLPARKPAIVYVHGGGPRQMLLGWHTRWEYANDYGANQYLASRGFIVLSVDYRLSVGYGQSFQFPENAGVRGASEYRDILAAGRYLQSRDDVDQQRIGIWGASLGGYLTALALGRNSDVFAAGVDVHGVHDRIPSLTNEQLARAAAGDGITDADLKQALKVAYESSPISAVSTWTSPVLLIHGDDDRAVNFHQTVDLERRLAARGVHVETLVLPDDVHDSLLWRNWVASISAMAEFFERFLAKG
ncbi:MAG TPA: prolyl oligopeptidase family serine peptidase [Terriglobia bacterium]|nr:prolyl oligopeptidase family serine peptidase [Terriglobia bacterium]